MARVVVTRRHAPETPLVTSTTRPGADARRRRPDPDDLRSKRVALTPRGASAIRVIREAVAELETAWAEQLGRKRFAQLRNVLLDLNQLA